MTPEARSARGFTAGGCAEIRGPLCAPLSPGQVRERMNRCMYALKDRGDCARCTQLHALASDPRFQEVVLQLGPNWRVPVHGISELSSAFLAFMGMSLFFFAAIFCNACQILPHLRLALLAVPPMALAQRRA